VLRIDRLVLLDEADGPTWWVLDYKLQHRPQELAAYHAQLAGYRGAVQAAQPGARVRSAFIAGDGSLIESV
jgi:ATP-dependent helicase/nuclease subunit A